MKLLEAERIRRFVMNKWVRALLIAATVVLVFIPAIYFLGPVIGYFSFKTMYSYYAGYIAGLTGINTYLARSLVVLAVIPFLFGIYLLFFSLLPTDRHRRRRYFGAVMLLSILIMYNMSLYLARTDIKRSLKLTAALFRFLASSSSPLKGPILRGHK